MKEKQRETDGPQTVSPGSIGLLERAAVAEFISRKAAAVDNRAKTESMRVLIMGRRQTTMNPFGYPWLK
ncbi:MAG: hypothetical protein LZF62_180031 [Nitrospira sp.]|nr:MAG: hypothetical protein LZF62_180031 [Nitrospira sp.]